MENPILRRFLSHTSPIVSLSACHTLILGFGCSNYFVLREWSLEPVSIVNCMALYRSIIIPEMDIELVYNLLPRDEAESPPPCTIGNEYDSRIGLRISSIFVILVGSIFGAFFPVVVTRFRGLRILS
jgi:hypothetical protein